ncbi:MAG: alpha-glucosidase C-terminal domain-containing protein [Prevotellaceae bacterium]|jgi:glycosidase|nr:alpha-glucosidase C-terminal domain-containing protein [Prevotellaceae bacterium]
MKKVIFFTICCVLLSTCGNSKNGAIIDDGINNNIEDNGNSDSNQFYDVAFTNVPTPPDVVMYEANERVFAANASFNAITNRLDEIKALGVNVLWLMPVNEQGAKNSIGSPYCVKNYTKVQPEYGTLESLRTLVKQAHSCGMAVIIDWVANHTSWDNGWIENKSWYTQDAAGNIISPAGAGWNDVADLNFDNADMRKAMIAAMKYWVYEANIDGFRCDAADMVPSDFWKQAIDSLRKFEGRTLLMLAEGNTGNHYASGFDMDYAWNFYTSITKLYAGQGSIANLYTTHTNEYKNIPAGKEKLRFTTNHDYSSEPGGSPITLYGGQQGSLSAFVLAATLGGSPLIYSTQEIGASSPVTFFSPTAIDWSMNPEFLAEYKKIMSIYVASEALRKGALQTYSHNDVACFYRLYQQTDGALVAVNVRNQAVTFNLPAQFVGQAFTNAFDGTTVELPASIEMQPYQYFIWTRKI